MQRAVIATGSVGSETTNYRLVGGLTDARSQGVAPFAGRRAHFLSDLLRTPEPARECCLTDRAALSRSGIAGRAAGAADVVVALLVAKDIAARSLRKLSPAAFKDPICCWLCCCVSCRRAAANGSSVMRRLCHASGKENCEENKRHCQELNSAPTHQIHLPSESR